MLRILTHTEINRNEWRRLVETSTNTSFFQTPECYEFYKTLSFLRPFLFGVADDNRLAGIACGYIISEGKWIKPYFSRRAIIPGGILLHNNISSGALEFLLSNVTNELENDAIYIEIRNFTDYSDYKKNFEAAAFSYHKHLNFQVNTASDTSIVYSKLSATKRRQIKQTLAAGVSCLPSTESKDIEVFYAILSDLHKTRIKTPLFSLEFFKEIVKYDFCHLFVVKRNDKVIGGICCVMLSNKTVYEWFVCGEEQPDTNIYPSTLATWTAIEYASKNGYSCFDFMGAGKPDKEYGVRDFKAKFGGELVEHGRFLYICKPFLYKVGELIMTSKFLKSLIYNKLK